MDLLSEKLYKAKEWYAGGLFEKPEKAAFYRYSLAYCRYLENVPLAEYRGGKLYPCGKKYTEEYAVCPDYPYTFFVDYKILEQKGNIGLEEIRKEDEALVRIDSVHTVGGAGYTHGTPNYKRIAREGLNSYVKRIERLPEGEFRSGLLLTVEGIRAYWQRARNYLQGKAPECLLTALEKVPFEPAENLYEALVCFNFIYYMDFCDNIGILDADLIGFYRGENCEEIFGEMFDNININEGWTATIGGEYNDLTEQILRAIRCRRRPTLELKIKEKMPNKLWRLCKESLMTGCGQPSFYNDKLYRKALREKVTKISKEDAARFSGVGCTETSLSGMTNAGSLDAGINVLLIFSDFARAGKEYASFSDFLEAFIQVYEGEAENVFAKVNKFRKIRAAVRPQPVRTLFIDDCIDRGRDYNEGGARYNWSNINLAGLINTIDSMLAVKEIVYEKKLYSLKQLFDGLDCENDKIMKLLKKCRCFGRGDEKADAFASRFTNRLLDVFDRNEAYPEGKFFPASIQFVTYTEAGMGIPATPDGRKKDGPLADSLGAILGKDREGITALLESVCALPLGRFAGTPVLNLRMSKDFLTSHLQDVVESYFETGGMMVQISCLSREDMEDALIHPELHENLIVRIGGYSEYFNRLSPELKKTVIQRTEYGS